jgi:hypothetical protein
MKKLAARMGKHGTTILVAMAVAMVTAGGPALARTVVDFAKNAGKVDGKKAVGANSSIHHRKGKLVATSKTTGRLPNNIIAKAPNAAKLSGHPASDFLFRPKSTQTYTVAGTGWTSTDGSVPLASGSSLTWCANMAGDFEIFQQVHLPQGATITGVSGDYVDDAGTTNVNGQLFVTRMPIFGHGGTYTDLFFAGLPDTPTPGDEATASGAPPTPTDPNLVVDNTKYVYDLIPVSGNAMLMCPASVTYTPAHGPSLGTPAGFPRNKAPVSGTPTAGRR